MRSDWTDLPERVTAAIAERVGGTFDVAQASSGDHAEIASTVTGRAGQVLVKVASGENATKWAAKSRQDTERWVRDLAMWTGKWTYHRTDGHQSAREPTLS
ncbi:hypothetical protein ACQPWR_09050 [Micromonospora vinacea]|uniref:hypothetical protein n=1 Tax=Micromonospora vinacea TaxID=709878 RepID=UPI003D8EC282